MSNTFSQKMVFWGRAILPASFCWIFIILTALPFHLPHMGPVTPLFLLMACYYWCVYAPDYMPYPVVFLLGLCADLLAGGPIGITPLMLMTMRLLMMGQMWSFLGRTFIVDWLLFFVLAWGVTLGTWSLASLYYREVLQFRPFVMQTGLTILLYPAMHWFLGRLQLGLMK